MTDAKKFWLIWTLLLAGALAVQAEQWGAWTKTDLAVCLCAENNGRNREEMAAISWVLQKLSNRRGVPLRATTRAYCAVFRKASGSLGEKRDIIRGSTLNAPAPHCAKRWKRIVDFVDDFEAGKVRDPCPRCDRWGGGPDVIPETWTCPLVYGEPPFEQKICYEQR
jgi:hypothetical protein